MEPTLTRDRIATLESARTLKMARSAHAYVRGNTAKFYEWLAASKVAKRAPVGPAIWICGDCHLGNLGPLSDGEGRVAVQIRDLDQTVIGNPVHDLIRLGLSLATAARGSDLPKGAKGRGDYALVDVKEAIAPIAPGVAGAAMPDDPAERVVAGARALSPHLGNRMIATRLLGRSVFLRELAPQDLKLEVDQFSQGQAVKAARYLARVVGKAHARQMNGGERSAWRRALLDHRGIDLDAPPWLWDAVVDLSGSHEAGYLEHCRRHALANAA